MLILCQLLHVFSTLYSIFIRFPGLTYWQDATVPVPCFLLFLVSEKLFWKYSRNWTPRRPKSLFSPEASRSPKESRRRAPEGPHHVQARPTLWPRLDLVWGPRCPPGVAPPPIYSLPPENPKERSLHPRKVPQPPSSSTLVRGTEISVPAPCRDGELPPEAISIDSTAIFIAVADSHDEEGVVLPRGWGLYR